ncbi:hypothetical protein AKJ48_04080 [candidate division MSBL1 archaeon SCGC-AAA261O19]|uniref:Threonine--tRNA ligase n=1 Tax=candidate division MSBL1 archaeon SCGC-AAA261O19 TaxID=1698277 RepID=A0A133VA26_9EURY|nr:hypothetical protein AKJ48_04080 [candidate division MSBL1 archaeon SCGC-AAA261O19]
MRILLIHADFLEFEAKEEAPVAEEVPEGMKSGRAEETLVVFMAVEDSDEVNPDAVVKNALSEIKEVQEEVGAQSIVLYPYAHLSDSLASPEVAIQVLDGLRNGLEEAGVDVLRLPFGWYKAFQLSCKGHPLSELSRTITPEAPEEEVEEEIPSEFLIVTPQGEEHELDLQNLEDVEVLNEEPNLKQFIRSEELGESVGKEPPHIKLMRRLELADYEPASDTGHLRYYPKGEFIRGMLEELADQIAQEVGATKIETPVLYRADEPDIREQASRFLQKDYEIKLPNRTLLLRFAGDFGLFKIMKNTTMSYKQLPIRVYELSPSYRLEQRGECVGLKRLRAFTMPDIHSFCLNLDQGVEEYEHLFKIYSETVEKLGINHVIAFRVVKDFYEENKELISRLLKDVGKPALVELLAERKHYWVMKHEFQEVDAVGGNGQLSTVQLDLEDSERYGIYYIDENGDEQGCIILHSSMGSIERWMYALLEEAAKQINADKPPTLPLWLAPTQVRLIPVGEEHADYCKELASKARTRVRIDIDDRSETVSKRVRNAEKEWIPFVVVIGDKELESEKVPVRIREEGDQKDMKFEELTSQITQKTEGMPYKPLPLPELLSLRPAFTG